MSLSKFQQIESEFERRGADAAIAQLADTLRQEQKYHELFDALLLRGRVRLGLPAISGTPLDELVEPLRGQMEELYLDACRDVGSLFLAAGQIREAWMYLRPTGERATIASALAQMNPSAENIEPLVEVAVHEGVCPDVGIKWVLQQYGTCQAITITEGNLRHWSGAQRRAVAENLVRHIYAELLRGVRADIARREGTESPEQRLGELLGGRDWLFAEQNYHIDTSHLAAVVRLARLTEDPDTLRLACELTDYGRRLSQQYQYAGEEPFIDTYAAHGLYFQALRGENMDEAVDFFRERARARPAAEAGTAAIETYVDLLSRVGRHHEALEAMVELVPPGVRTMGLAPGLLELARRAGSYDRLRDRCVQQDDLVGFVASLLQQRLGST